MAHAVELGSPVTAAPVQSSERRERLASSWWLLLAALVAYGALSQVFVIAEAWRANPLAAVPIVDADTYWQWAADIADGRLLGSTPFMSAPLYPYLLGAVRAAGGGLLAVYVLQAIMHLATIVLLAYGTARRVSPTTGLVAGALYVLLSEPAFFTGRVLNCTLQLLLVVLLWLALTRAQRTVTHLRCAFLGLLTGLNCLANPPMILAAILLAPWLWWQCGGKWRGLSRALVFGLAAGATVLPATVHNVIVSGEFIPISAQAGVTFAQGNGPGANGTYTPIPGVSTARQSQNIDALRLYRSETGEAGGWRAASRHFFLKGLDYWRSAPMAAAELLCRKFYWFISARNVGDIYFPALERETGYAHWLRTAPLPTAWITLPGLAALAVFLRNPRRYGPKLILALVPLAVVLLFWFSPRYRLPAVPMLVVGTAWSLTTAARRPVQPARLCATLALLGAGPVLGAVNQSVGFDNLDKSYRAAYHHGLAKAFAQAGRTNEAMAEYERALELKPDDHVARGDLGNLLRERGQLDRAVAVLRAAVRAEPADAVVNDQLGRALAESGRPREGLPYFQAAVRIRPERADLRYNLAVTLLSVGNNDAAKRQFQAVLDLDERHAKARIQLAELLRASGDTAGAIDVLKRGLALSPRDEAIMNELARYQATTPGREAKPSHRRRTKGVTPCQNH